MKVPNLIQIYGLFKNTSELQQEEVQPTVKRLNERCNWILKVYHPLYLWQIFECYVSNLYSFFIIFKYLLVLSIF